MEKGPIFSQTFDENGNVLTESFGNPMHTMRYFVNYQEKVVAVTFFPTDTGMTFRAKAVCLGSDEFDLETGMRICRKKVLAKYTKMKLAQCTHLREVFQERLDKCDKMIEKYKEKLQRYSNPEA